MHVKENVRRTNKFFQLVHIQTNSYSHCFIVFHHSDCYSQLQNKVSHICEENFAYSSVAAILFNVGRENCGGPISSIFGDIIVYMYAKFGTFITK